MEACEPGRPVDNGYDSAVIREEKDYSFSLVDQIHLKSCVPQLLASPAGEGYRCQGPARVRIAVEVREDQLDNFRSDSPL
jgi:hypothetical protein